MTGRPDKIPHRAAVTAAGTVFVLLFTAMQLGNVRSGAAMTGETFLLRQGMLLVLAGTAAAFLAGFLLEYRILPLSGTFLLCGFFLGMMFLNVMPGLSAPDEVSHYITSYRMSNRLLGKPDLSSDLGLVEIRAGDFPLEDLYGVKTLFDPDDVEETPVILGNPVDQSTYVTIRNWDAVYPAEDRLVSSALPDIRTTPAGHIVPAIGFSIARILGLNAPALVFCGRLANLLFFLFFTAAAIRLLPFGKEVMAGTALLPMTLHLAASLSYDVLLLAAIFLFTAEVLSLAYGNRKGSLADVLLLCVLAAAFGPCKLVYSLVTLLVFLIPAEKLGGKGRKAALGAAVLGCAAAALFLVNASIIHSYAATEAGTAAVRATNEAGYSVSELLHRPMFIFQMLRNTFAFQGDELHLGMIGMWLGNMDPLLGVPYIAVQLFSLGLLLLALKQPGETAVMPVWARLWSLGIAALVVLALCGAMLVSWTTRSAVVIEGLQGRYFLPILPLILFTFKNDKIVLTGDCRREILFAFFCMDVYAAVRIFGLACTRL